MNTKVYITNITSDILHTNGDPEITAIGLHKLICCRQVEGCPIEKDAIAILHPDEYKEVIQNGFYIVSD
jgi:hypothetical protein